MTDSRIPKLGTPGEAPTLDTFWKGGRHWALRSNDPEVATDDVVLAAEEKFGIRLPELMKELYRRQNGGYTGFRSYPKVPEPRPGDDDWFCVCPDGDVYPVHWLETLGELADTIDFGIEDEDFCERFEDADRLIVLSRHGSDVMLCLDYRSTSDPQVVLLEETGEGLDEVLRVSDFATFFADLRRGS